MRRMLLALILLAGCAAPPAALPRAPAPLAPIVLATVEIVGQAPAGLREQLLTAYRRWPQAHGGVSRIELCAKLMRRGAELAGMYNNRTRVLTLALDSPQKYVVETLYHELGHAIWNDHFVSFERRWWAERYERVKRLDGEVPSKYATKTAREFFAEHIAMRSVAADAHARVFPIENHEMTLQGIEPR